jgi:mono/diheme cytochrome c family protein
MIAVLKIKNVLLFHLFFLFCFACQPSSDPSAPSALIEQKPTSFSLPFTWELAADQLKGDTLISIESEFLFKKNKTYQAFPFQENLAAILPADLDRTGLEIVFQCVDGYSPSIPLSYLDSSAAYLAYRDLELATTTTNWGDSLEQKFAPFYIVWEKNPVAGKNLPWAYGLYQIEINSFAEEYQYSIPTDSQFATGFELFQHKCMKCHSINQEGGRMAPEFNYPKNITEYWNKEDIWAFAKAPQSYRSTSLMPAVTDLERSEFDQIYDYLQHISVVKPALD